MANMTADITRRHKGADIGLMQYGMVGYTNIRAASVEYTIYKGACVMMDVSDVDGYAQPMYSGLTVDPADAFLGIAVEQKKVLAANTADGSVTITVATKGDWAFPCGSLTVTDIGALIYVSDDGTLTTTAADMLWIGHIVDVDSAYAWVRIDLAAGMLSTGA